MNMKNIVVGRLNDHIDELDSFIDGLAPAQLRARPDTDQKSIWEIALHIVDLQDISIGWLARMLVEDLPGLEDGPNENGPDNRYFDQDLFARLKEFREHRKNLISLLNALTDSQWKKEGIHPRIKHFTVEKCVEGLMRHEEHHLYHIYNLFFGMHIAQ